MKKILLFLSIIFTFGLILVPLGKCASYNDTAQLSYVNRINSIDYDVNSFSYYLHIDRSNYSFTGNVRYALQVFHKENLITPIQLNSISYFTSISIGYFSGLDFIGTFNEYSMTTYTTNNNYAYYYNSSINCDFIRIKFSNIIGNLSDYVFNITMTPNASYFGVFVPNDYYKVGAPKMNGAFTGYASFLEMAYTNARTDISDYITYNKISLGTSDNVDLVFNQNSSNANYHYYLVVDFGGKMLSEIPNDLQCSYLEIYSICANNVIYNTYSSATSALEWLGTNIVLYENNTGFFKSDSTKANNNYDTIQWVKFRLADADFASSSYYQSAVGLRGYLSNTCLYTDIDLDASSLWYDSGYSSGYEDALRVGYDLGLQEGYGDTSFGSLMLSVADFPVHIISSILNFEILGTNLMSLFTAIISLFLFIWLVRRLKEQCYV